MSEEMSVVDHIQELFEARIRPAVAQDGGDVIFVDFDEETGVVSVQLAGACNGCPGAMMTLKYGVEEVLKEYIPEVKGIKVVS
ncbi:MAG: NifU family protein [Alphaproteobacteria bacterium]|nr:NifU family protein [Alphaproteobacteria bacterium]